MRRGEPVDFEGHKAEHTGFWRGRGTRVGRRMKHRQGPLFPQRGVEPEAEGAKGTSGLADEQTSGSGCNQSLSNGRRRVKQLVSAPSNDGWPVFYSSQKTKKNNWGILMGHDSLLLALGVFLPRLWRWHKMSLDIHYELMRLIAS